MNDHQPDYSWIKPGVLAVIVPPCSQEVGAVVRCLSSPSVREGMSATTYQAVFTLLVSARFLTPPSSAALAGKTDILVKPKLLRPLDFPEEADIEEISRDMEIVG